MSIFNNAIFTVLVPGILVFLSGCAHLDDINKMMALKRSDDMKQYVLNQETASFEKVKKYMDSGKMEKGMGMQSVLKEFGEPLLIYYESPGAKWVYKPASASWFEGEKIYLFFDEEGKLVKWECIGCN